MENLYRGKRTDNGEWVQGFYFEDTGGLSVIQTPRTPNTFTVDSETVGQYTGFNDDSEKNIKIFDGSILRGTWEESTGDGCSEKMWVDAFVSWDEDKGKWIVNEIPSGEEYEIYDWMPERKVIGNIYDNPEFLYYHEKEVQELAETLDI